MKGEDGLENVNEWLEEGPPLRLQPLEDEYGLVPLQQPREFRGAPLWWENDIAPEEELLKEHPATARRNRLREWSERFGWIYDIAANLRARWQEFWTPMNIIACFVLLYLLLMSSTVWILDYYLFSSALRRTLPTIEELMQPASTEEPVEGSPIPTEGLNDTKETDE